MPAIRRVRTPDGVPWPPGDAGRSRVRRAVSVLVSGVALCAAFLVVGMAPAAASAPGEPTVWLDCDPLGHGCIGLSGEFDTNEAAAGSLEISVFDSGTGVSTVVTDEACRTRRLGGHHPAVRVSCMLDALGAGIVGPVVWDVTLGGAVVWTSPPIGVTCGGSVDEGTTTTTVPPVPEDPAPPDGPPVEVVEVTPIPQVAAGGPGQGGPGTAAGAGAPDASDLLEVPDVPPVTLASSISGTIAPAVPAIVEPSVMAADDPVVAHVLGSDAAQAQLPVTGMSLGVLAAAGTAMLGVGLVLQRVGRRCGEPGR